MESIFDNLQIYLAHKRILAYPLVFISGILVSFTPCVYPLLPITIGFIGSAASNSLRRNFLLSLAYVLGLSLVYAALGAAASLTGFFLGQITGSGWTYFAVGIIFAALGLGALGVYNIPFIGFRKSSSKPKSYFGTFLVGAVSAFAVGPCIAPALGVILTYVAAKRDVFFGISLLFTFAVGMSMLFLLLGTFSSMLKIMPKAGKANAFIEKIFGLILLAAGVIFLAMAPLRLF